ncbi:MAG: hypothetical protein M5U14_05255 [Acidimicrobiia bacterium]|nr:hypothetical protein [Acidimicrobiia bacterium]
MDDQPEATPSRTFIGGRHGSPTITVAFPFSQVKTTDPEVREAVSELASLVARLAEGLGGEEGRSLRAAAEAVAERLRLDG